MSQVAPLPRRRIYLMRHGSVDYFDADGQPMRQDQLTLSQSGIAQAQAAGALLRDIRFDRVVSSGLLRTRQTAQLVLDASLNNAPPAIEAWPELDEMKNGRLENIARDDLERSFLDVFRGIRGEQEKFLGGETLGQLFDRVIPALQKLLSDRAWDTLLLVLHGGVNRSILSYALTGQRMFLGAFEQAPACINVLDVDDSHWVVHAVNVAPTDWLHGETRSTTMEMFLQEYLKGVIKKVRP